MEGPEESVEGTEADLIYCGLVIGMVTRPDHSEPQIVIRCNRLFGHTDNEHSGSTTFYEEPDGVVNEVVIRRK